MAKGDIRQYKLKTTKELKSEMAIQEADKRKKLFEFEIGLKVTLIVNSKTGIYADTRLVRCSSPRGSGR